MKKTRAAATPFARRVIWAREWFDIGHPIWALIVCVLWATMCAVDGVKTP